MAAGVGGVVNGAFVNDGANIAAGVIGEFGLSGAGSIGGGHHCRRQGSVTRLSPRSA